MNSLEAQYPHLKLFCQMNWEEVTREYEDNYFDISFPQYLQQKAIEGDCPDYLFELAYYEMAFYQAQTLKLNYPYLPGIYLNPSTLFLSFEYDIPAMLELVKQEGPALIERSIYLSIYQDTHGRAHAYELNHEELQILQLLEDGPAFNYQVFEDFNLDSFRRLSEKEIILDLLKN